MKKYFYFIILIFLTLATTKVSAADRLVSNTSDAIEEGTLRKVLQAACDDSGDDTISFLETDEFKVKINSPLVIPQDCKGKITINGSSSVETIINGSNLTILGDIQAGDSCMIDIYSDNNTLKNLTLVGNDTGAAICLFGKNNLVEANHIGVRRDGFANENLYGVVVDDFFQSDYEGMDGSGNEVSQNQIQENVRNGIWIRATSALVQDNQIIGNGSNGIWIQGSQSVIAGNTIQDNGSAGIYVEEDSSELMIGGESFDDDKNTIQYNQDGGVWITDDQSTDQIAVSHNIISQNYNSGIGIDLGSDGETANDFNDVDQGPNKLLNFVDHFQVFPLVDSPTGQKRYWAWGVAQQGSELEIYGVAAEDFDRGVEHGGGDTFYGDIALNSNPQISISGATAINTFALKPTAYHLQSEALTVLSRDNHDNTSEYALAVGVGADADLDGILDEFETGDGTETSSSSSANNPDTDGDALADSVEDKNRNGIWDIDAGETSAYKADSDDDGLSDWYEVHGDGVYNPDKDTDPLNPDTDGDGFLDGKEDENHNGLWETYLGETHPLIQDTDADGYIDSVDNCPSVFNSGQESWYCQI